MSASCRLTAQELSLPNSISMKPQGEGTAFTPAFRCGGSAVKNPPPMQEMWVRSLAQEDLLEKEWQLTPGLSPGKSQGQRSLAGYSPWGPKS